MRSFIKKQSCVFLLVCAVLFANSCTGILQSHCFISSGTGYDSNEVYVVSIKKTQNNGFDLYTIIYSDASTSTFTVTINSDGSLNIDSHQNSRGQIPVVTLGSNGNWFVNGKDTGIEAQDLLNNQNENGENENKFDGIYGIKWAINNNYDPGQRCFSATGLKAWIGIGNQNGYSDFDNIYPWSEIKRCNIFYNENGTKTIVYEGEEGFSLDGSNGDVFVRIPNFRISRYEQSGYEYRVIGDSNSPVHEAFIEDGKVIDEIFIGAFEGYLEKEVLYSIADVIPTSNQIASVYLEAANKKGNQYSLYDMRCVDALWTLMIIEYGYRNTNHILGYGLADFLQPISENKALYTSSNTNSITVELTKEEMEQMPLWSTITICDGTQKNIIAQRTILNCQENGNIFSFTFDGDPLDITPTCFVGSGACKTNFCEKVKKGNLLWHTGRADWNAAKNTRNPIRYRWIENVFGNLWHMLPDVTFVNGQMYYCQNMNDYCFGSHDGVKYFSVGSPFIENNDNGIKTDVTGSNYWITALANESAAKSVLFGKQYDKNLQSKDAFGGYYYLNTNGTYFICNGGGFDHLWRCNMLTNRAWISSASYWYLYGARLIFKSIS